MTKPTLPHQDPHADRRAAQLAEQQQVWHLDKSYHGLVFADPDSVVRSVQMTLFARIWVRFSWGTNLDALVGLGPGEVVVILWHKLQTRWNSFRTRWEHAFDGPRERLITRFSRVIRRLNGRLTTRIWQPETPDRTPRPWSERQPLTEQQLKQTLPALPKPASYDRWRDDEFFAWERVAGQVPILIEWIEPGSLKTVLRKLPITPTRYAEARPGDTLDGAEADGRLFVVDLAVLDGIESGVSFGWRKWLTAPVALFALTSDRQHLLPVAIQCGQDPADTAYFTPSDGERWQLAKIHFQVAESNYHGVVEHGTLCHMLVGAIGVSARRQLAPVHPLRVLLEPHIEHTIGVNIATRSLFGPGGLTTELQSVSLKGTVDLSLRGWRTFDWRERSTEREFSRRGVQDPEILPIYPFRDDSERVTAAIRDFVTAYVDLYYGSDEEIIADRELSAWFDEMAATDIPDGVEIATITRPTTRQDVAAFFTDLIWRISPYHAVINYRVYESMGFVAFTPTAAYAPPPDQALDYGPEDWLWSMPPQDAIDAQVEDTWNVSSTRMNHLGHYGRHFRDKRVRPLIRTFLDDLDRVEQEITHANKGRMVDFDTLLPSNLTNSIHI